MGQLPLSEYTTIWENHVFLKPLIYLCPFRRLEISDHLMAKNRMILTYGFCLFVFFKGLFGEIYRKAEDPKTCQAN